MKKFLKLFRPHRKDDGSKTAPAPTQPIEPEESVVENTTINALEVEAPKPETPIVEALENEAAAESPAESEQPPAEEGQAVETSSETETFEDFAAAKQRVREANSRPEDLQSVLFFTTHKCASTFVTALLDNLDAQSPYSNMNYEGAYWELGDEVDQSNVTDQQFMIRHYDALFSQFGEIYGPIRRPIDFPGRERFKHIFFFRDPRDVLVSMFFSFAYTHPEPLHAGERERFRKWRERLLEGGIDAFVTRKSTEILGRFEGFNRLSKSAESALVLRYDEFATETEQFLNRIAEYLEIDLPQEVIENLAQSASPVRKGDTVMEHKRSGKSGQWQHELKPETAEFLTERFKDTLDTWGFK